MSTKQFARRGLRAAIRRWPGLKPHLVTWHQRKDALRHEFARVAPVIIQPQPRNLTVAITAHCNLRCEGCRYGRDFMPGAQLPMELVSPLLEDAAQVGFEDIRFYGGEPLLHPDLPAMVEQTLELGMQPYVTTNATLLERRIDELYGAGLRCVTIGFYGTGEHFDAYTHRPGAFERLERGVAAVRERYGDEVKLRLNWLLMRPSCELERLEQALDFARRYRTPVQIDLIHYSLPYFTEGHEGYLQFKAEDRPRIERVVKRLLEVKREEPELIEHSEIGLRAIPDWLLQAAGMRVPCDKYRMVWVGADGKVQLCYVTFELGDLRETRLRDMLLGGCHRDAARRAFALDCPNCHCSYDSRTVRHLASRRRYGGPGQLAE